MDFLYNRAMDIEEFRRVAVLGLGRTILWLRKNPWQPHAETIAYICSHNTAFDAQCEGSRAPYAYDLVACTDDRDYFVKVTVAALTASKDYWNTHQLFDLATFALDGNPAAAQPSTINFRADAEEPVIGAGGIMQLDGINGLLFVLDRIGQWVDAHPDFWVDDGILCEAIDRLGKQIPSIVEEEAKSNSNIRKYVVAQEKWLKECKANWKSSEYRQWKYSELRERIVEKGKDTPRGWLTGWGRHASDDGLREAALDDAITTTHAF